MKISYIRIKGDNKNYRLARGMGFNVFELEDPEMIDKELNNLKNKNYDTIIITNELIVNVFFVILCDYLHRLF